MNNMTQPEHIRQFDLQIRTQTLPLLCEHYRQSFQASARAKHYVREQLGEACSLPGQTMLGFADRTMGNRLPTPRSVEGQLVRGVLKRLGIIRPSGHEVLSGCVIVFLQQAEQLHAIYGERIGRRRKGAFQRLWIPLSHENLSQPLPEGFKPVYELAMCLSQFQREVQDEPSN
ncbi:hypothetical protein CWC22_000315 [Pseudoalteromonas rubra]|jgi:hypothetical protein|uniref:Uncharacterized protein n=1 Tax=Pseudoalteromonas rubra TaxID=43658 RepID=A0A5S3UQ26_9GAMM|nr:hypothetical protein [Pseudoalteromonas rubra]QPB81544.1 hypothetical protein CWC22_000315 [Pseudoalteromonas rubra]